MDRAEIAGHLQRQWRQFIDRHRPPDWAALAETTSQPAQFPVLPDVSTCPSTLRSQLRKDAQSIVQGRVKLFGRLPAQVEQPPRWQKDYIAGVDLTTLKPASRLNHRSLPKGADIKVVWELSRWSPLVRLAQAAWVLGDKTAQTTCLRWLNDWVEQNPPFRGYHWTSALEAGIRLVQMTWIDALLEGCRLDAEEQAMLKRSARVLPAHAWHVWRYRSFGSSANNHLLGELSGLQCALARWPALDQAGVPGHRVHRLWQDEVLRQFAQDGGNREQALNYHLFAFEFCWQALLAARKTGRSIDPAVIERLSRARDFYVTVQVADEPWDYGDSDSAWVTPFFEDEQHPSRDWMRWLSGAPDGEAIHFWLGDPPALNPQPAWVLKACDWQCFAESGIAVASRGSWRWRWDASPLGYLSTAAHGHLDALHVSLWYKGKAFVIDPGTAVYYADPGLRRYLASWIAHNGPHVQGADFPQRLGSFLWAQQHSRPTLLEQDDSAMAVRLDLPVGSIQRTMRRLANPEGWQVEDHCRTSNKGRLVVNWQFAPECRVKPLRDRVFLVSRAEAAIEVHVDDAWNEVRLIQQAEDAVAAGEDWAGTCSPAFRQVTRGPMIRLLANANDACNLRTSFLASGLP